MSLRDNDQQGIRLFTEQVDNQITHADVRQRTLQAIRKSLALQIDSLIRAPPAAGKSRGAFEALSNANKPAVYLSPRKDLYEQAMGWCEEENLSYHRLPSMPEHCNTFESGTSIYDAYHRGFSPHRLHEKGLCSWDRCEYEKRQPRFRYSDGNLGYVPSEFADVLIGHPKHAHVPQYVNNRILIFDDVAAEMYIEEYDVSKQNLHAILTHADCPVQTPEELYRLRDDPEYKAEMLEWVDSVAINCWQDGQTHTNAKKIVKTVLSATELENGYGYYFGEDFWGITDGDCTVYLLESPNLRPSETVIALDAYPILSPDDNIPVWWITRLGVWLDTTQVLSEEETREFISDVLGLDVIQTTIYAKPYSSGNYVTPQKDRKVIEFVSRQQGIDTVPVITSKKAKEYLKDEVDWEEYDFGVEWMQFSEVHSNNKFADRETGLVLGSPHYGDAYLKRIGAFMGQSISSADGKGMEKEYGQVGNAILQNMREDTIAQSILRFGRSEDIDATVYVRTAAIPDYIPVSEQPPDYCDSLVNAEAQVKMAFLHGDDASMTTSEVAERVSCSRRRVQQVLQKLELTGELRRQRARQPNHADKYYLNYM